MTSMCSTSTLFLQLICFLPFGSSRTGFVKDQNEDLVQFPPKILQTFESSIPVGHLRPLGWQRSPDGRVTEKTEMPTPQVFNEEYVKTGKPVVFRKVLKDAPAMTSWNKKNYLRDKYGEIDIDVVVKKELLKSGPQKMKFKKFLKEYLYEDWYLSNYAPVEMMHELVLPKCLKCGFNKWLMESEIWMSSGGTSSLLHSHADHDLHCLLAGRKDFIFIDAKYKEHLNFKDETPYLGAGHSDMDMDQINMFKFKKLHEIPWIWSTLRQGDCIFVPAGYLHQVRSYGRSISSTNHFAPTPELDFTDCGKTKLDEKVLLSEAGFLWMYTKGQLVLANSQLNVPSMRHVLLMVMRNQDSMSQELFGAFYDEVMSEAKDFPPVETVWSYISSNSTIANVDRKDIKNLPDDVLLKLAEVFNIPHKQMAARDAKTAKHTEL